MAAVKLRWSIEHNMHAVFIHHSAYLFQSPFVCTAEVHKTIVWWNISDGTITTGLLFPASLWSCLSSMFSGIEWACLWMSDLPGKPCEWGISTVKLRHVSSHSATHPGLLKKHRPGWQKQNSPCVCVCHLLEVSWKKNHIWHSCLNRTDLEPEALCIFFHSNLSNVSIWVFTAQ